MYRIIFELRPKAGQEEAYIAQWQKGSDVIQSYPGAHGTKLFRDPDMPDVLYAMAEWGSKEARLAAMTKIKEERPDADIVLRGHEQYLDSHIILGEFECIAESNPPLN